MSRPDLAERNYKHGMNCTPEHFAHGNAKARCTNPNNKMWKDYGGRGIEFRFKSFVEFFAELGMRPSTKHTIDRIDNDGHYEKGNVRWASRTEQNRHKRGVKLSKTKAEDIRAIYASGTITQAELANMFGTSQPNIGYIVRDETWQQAAEGKF